jgi:diguanylate cyclase (GGDEF)-like protein
MKNRNEDPDGVFRKMREIIEEDPSIAPEEKEGTLKLIQVLMEAAESSPATGDESGESNGSYAREIVSKHSLTALVKQQADELDALRRISLNLTSSLDLQTVLDAVVAEAMRLVRNARSAHIYLYSNGVLDFGASLDIDGEKNKIFTPPRENGLTYSVARSGVEIIVENIKNHPLFRDISRDWASSIIGIPLKFSNSIVGVMNLSRSISGKFTRAELRLLGLLADHAAVAISNARLHKVTMELAYTDSVTALPNRRALDERLQEEFLYAQRMHSQFSVVMMDVDGFKKVNDTLGHSTGDDVLRSVFNYLAERMRSTDFLARYGGDELTLVMRQTGLEVAEIVTRKLIDLMNEYTLPLLQEKNIKLGITAGIAVYPIHSYNPGDLLRAADAALYQAKKRNRGSYVVARGMTGQLDPNIFNRRPRA